MSAAKPADTEAGLPPQFARWFASRGWSPRAHQLELLAHGRQRRSTLLIAPTGGGKTLAGFLPSLVELSQLPASGARPYQLHTLYISPLKALAVDVARNLQTPVEEMGLGLRIESRTGDTPTTRRQRQRYAPPDILLTTPEQIALMLAASDAGRFFGQLRVIILDEVHALHNSKRGDLLALGLARLQTLAPAHVRIGLSATVADPEPLQRFLVPQPEQGVALSSLVIGQAGARPKIRILASQEYIP
ncbi:MAG: DEAD/DEAH box helicase, partial [Alphaproteobacteria bacterium]|nr:DEAD/DEAH box helicase [Alphaproteobacteria bacterium]